jgi:hypothetical protein
VAASSRTEVERAIKRIREAFPQSQPGEDCHVVDVTFWWHGAEGNRQATRELAVPSWDEIRSNYVAGTRETLEALMTRFHPGDGGQLLLFQGAPGTGKSFALRALAWEWRTWAEVQYVTDPEVLFERDPGYLMEVVMRSSPRRFNPIKDEKWRVIVLEDTGEMLSLDAKDRVGQGLSRLLNLVDGLLGQGLRVLVLISTNEGLDRLHPAVARPGRCAATIEFGEFSAAEAETWLRSRSARGTVLGAGTRTLAELHALAEGRTIASESRGVGFSVA